MYLNPPEFDAFLNKVGQTCAWRRAYACPCINPNSGAADPKCPRCAGKGFAWATAVQGTAGISGQQVQKRWADFGKWEAGDVVVSIGSDSPLYAISFADRVLFLNDTQGFSVVLTRGQGDTLGFPTVAIDRVYWLDGQKREVAGSIPTFDADGALSWGDSDVAPPDGVLYSVSGRRRTEYFCWGDYPQDRGHFHGRALPKKVVLRRFDLYGRT